MLLRGDVAFHTWILPPCPFSTGTLDGMDLWPSSSPSSIAKRNTQKRSKGKHNSTEPWSNYPILDHGAKTAATLIKVGDELEWRTVLSARKGSLTTQEKPSKIYPCTKPVEITNADASLRQRAEQGARFLRTYHPDVDIPFDVIKDSIEYDDKLEKQRAAFDQFSGNLLSATYCFEGVRKKAIALAFPTGPLRCDLYVSPIYLRQNSVLFQPRAQSLWSFDTPIRQIVSSAAAVNLVEKKSYSLAVRTYGQVSVFDIRNQMTSSADPTKSPFAISETMSIRSHEFDSGQDGSILDMAFSGSDPTDLFFVTEHGAGYRCSGKGERKIVNKLFDSPVEDNSSFWRIASDQTSSTGTLASEKALQKFDTRIHGISMDPLEYNDGRNVITSICPTQLAHLLCVATTSQVIWIDERFPKQPLLGWKHHRAFDRTLGVQTIEFADTSLAFLGSSKNDLVSVISVGHLQDGPLQCQMPARSLPHAICGGPVAGRTLIRHPGTPSGTFSLVELSVQGSLHHQELEYSVDTSTVGAEQDGYVDNRFRCRWSDGVHELERQSKDLRPDYGKLAARERVVEDLSGVYEELFGEKARKVHDANEEAKAEDVYETLEKMPFFWQRSDTGEDHMHTLFDVAFGSGEQPLHEARADFLTGTVLDSARGYRARQQGRIPVDEVAEKAGWHMNIQPILNKISPEVFKDTPTLAEELDPYLVSREEEIPAADRRESEAREQLALDLALSADVFSAIPMRNLAQQQPASGEEVDEGEAQEDAETLSRAAAKLSLTGKEPPQVTFGFLRPVVKDGGKHQRDAKQKDKSQVDEASDTEEEGGGIAKMPLSVRLLLSEWNIGDDPYKYEYVDPYDLDASGAETQRAKASRRHRQQRRSLSGERDSGPSRPVHTQAPPTIIAARTLAGQGKQPGAVRVSQSSIQRPPAHPQTQTQMPYGGSQIDSAPSSSQPAMMTNTQVLPGLHGGRPGTGKKKPPKKRLGGF